MNYNSPLGLIVNTHIEFEWDPEKSEDCYEERGFDFSYATRAFLDPNRVQVRDCRFEYGEDRYRLMGNIEGRLFVIVYTKRNNSYRLISARKANLREVTFYEKTRSS